MSITISSNSLMVGNLFSSMNAGLLGASSNNSFTSSMLGFNYSDYSSIRNGSYHKLLSSYFSLDDVKPSGSVTGTDSASKTNTTDKTEKTDTKKYNYWNYWEKLPGYTKPAEESTSTSKEETSALTTLKSDAKNLSEAVDPLLAQGSKSLFNQVSVKDEEGNTTKDYDTNAIYKAVSGYVKNYNSLLESAGESNVMAIRASASSMRDLTKANEERLASVGIKINAKDHTLSIDEDAFKAADMSAAKKLFNGTNSYAYQVSTKASAIESHAQYESTKANTYNNAGNYSYNYSSGSTWNSMI